MIEANCKINMDQQSISAGAVPLNEGIIQPSSIPHLDIAPNYKPPTPQADVNPLPPKPSPNVSPVVSPPPQAQMSTTAPTADTYVAQPVAASVMPTAETLPVQPTASEEGEQLESKVALSEAISSKLAVKSRRNKLLSSIFIATAILALAAAMILSLVVWLFYVQ